MVTPDQDRITEQEDNPLFICAECGAPIIVHDGAYFRECEHLEAAVLANMQAVVRGVGTA